MGVSGADNSVKIWRNLPISNLEPDLHNIKAHTKLGENPLMFTHYRVAGYKKKKVKIIFWFFPLFGAMLAHNSSQIAIPITDQYK